MPFRHDVRHRLVGPAPRDDGRDADRPLRQPEHRVHRRRGRSRRRSCSACAARRATRSTTRRATGCRSTRPRVFVEQVDCVSGVGYDRAAAAGRRGAVPRDPPRRHQHGRLRLRDARPLDAPALGAPRRHRRRGRRGAPASRSSCPTTCPRRGCRPTRSCASSARCSTRSDLRDAEVRRGVTRVMHPALHTRLCDLVGVRVPDRADRHGLGRRRRGSPPATANAGGLGILAAATMTFDRARAPRSAR